MPSASLPTWTRRALAAAALVAAGSYLADGAEPAAVRASGPQATASATAAPEPASATTSTPTTGTPTTGALTTGAPTTGTAGAGSTVGGPGELLLPAEHGDGDSWRDTHGRSYRLGLVNAPEQGECFGRQATAERKALVAGGFRAEVYAQDRYGRGVSVVTTADGREVNVHLARYGFADDRYLQQFQHQNPQLAARLEEAFAAARAERRGLWGACPVGDRPPPSSARSSTPADAAAADVPPPAPVGGAAPGGGSGPCHPDYTTCVPVQGDGSGRGGSNDLDCGQLGESVQLRQAGVDPYRLDGDGDGVACDG